MNPQNKRWRFWLNLFAQVLSFLNVLVSLLGATIVYVTQAQSAVTSLWPLPGLILLEWALLSVIGFASTYLVVRGARGKWLRGSWFISGAFIPLIILRALSIGPFVLLAFLLFVISTIILTVQRRLQWLLSFGLLMLGSLVNLGLLILIITLGSQPTAF
jgi:hypothetical protein